MKSQHERSDELAKISKNLMLEQPFYGIFLIMLNKVWDNQSSWQGRKPTACVSRNGINYQLTLNEMYWDELEDKIRQSMLQHELLHIGLFHVTDYGHLTDYELRNIAMDLVVNQLLPQNAIGEGWVRLTDYPELNLEPNKSTIYYYEKLQKGKKDGNCPNLNAMLEAMGAGKNTVQFSFSNGKSGEGDVPDHSLWKEFDELDDATKGIVKKQAEYILKEIADQVIKSRGTIPGEFKEIFDRINHVEPPKFDWKGFTRRFVGGSTEIFTKKTRRKYNKRYEENPGLKIKPKAHVLAALDTSGSVSSAALKEVVGELYHIQKLGIQVTVVESDASISLIQKFDYRKEFHIHGRGGTDFTPVVDYYNKNLHKYTCLIYFTDGCAPPPENLPKGKMLWVIDSKGEINKNLPGQQIKLEL